MSSSKHSKELRRLALSVLQPGFVGTVAPDWILRDIGDGLASVVLFARNIASPSRSPASPINSAGRTRR